MPFLPLIDVLAAAFTVNVPLFDPLAGVTVSQVVALLATVHVVFDVTVAVVLPPAAVGSQVVGVTVRTTGAPAWVTAMVRL